MRQVINCDGKVFLLLAAAGVVSAQSITIRPAAPTVVQAGETLSFGANQPVTWSLAPGSLGTIDPDGTYHAPQHIDVKQALGGCQVLPANHVFNVRVDNLPVLSSSTRWIQEANNGNINYLPSFPTNYIDSTVSREEMQEMVFAYTPRNNGLFHLPAYPDARIESGWFTPPFAGMDRHLLALEKDVCKMQEIYNLYPRGTNNYNPCPACTSQSGVQYALMTYALPASGSTDAASMYLEPLTLHLQDIDAALRNRGSIRHALRFTISRPAQTFIWPALASATYGIGDRMPMGARVRLNANFNTSRFTNPVTLLLLQQLKEYGLILADAGYPWQIQTDSVNLPPLVRAAFAEVRAAVKPTDMQVVDESSLLASPLSGDTGVDAETVIATSVRNPGQRASARVMLRGVAVGALRDEEFLQAGIAPVKMTGWISGASTNRSLRWTISDKSLGSITPDGVFTPPAAVSGPRVGLIQVSSVQDPQAFANIRITILPAGVLRIAMGSARPFTDSHGNVWLAGTGYNGGWDYDNGGTWTPSVGMNPTDIPLYKQMHYADDDLTFRYHVPNGTYRLTGMFGEAEVGPGQKIFHLETQGNVIYRNVDVSGLTGGDRRPYSLDMPATVTDGTLTFVIRHVRGHVNISSLVIQPDPGTPRLEVTPKTSGSIAPTQTQQFYAIGWFITTPVKWEVNPAYGRISANGLYSAPFDAPSQDTPVTITATSTVNPSLKASTRLTVLHKIPPIRINAGGPAFTDGEGNAWSADYGFVGYSIFYSDSGARIRGAAPGQEPLYQYSRYNYSGSGTFSYELPTGNGNYTVRLKWAEYRAEAQHTIMDVSINGKKVLSDFDPTAAAGGVRIAFDQVFRTTVTNGLLRIDFTAKPPSVYVGASINGIEILPVP